MSQAEAHELRHRKGLLQLKGNDSANLIAGYARQISHPGYENLVRTETILRRLVPALIVLFLLIAGLSRWGALLSDAEIIKTQSRSEMHYIAELIEQKLVNSLQQEEFKQNPSAIQNVVSDAVPMKFRTLEKSVLVTSQDGTIVASVPFRSELNGQKIDAILQNVLLLTTFGSKAETRDIKTTAGKEALAVHRFLPQPFGGVTLIQPKETLYKKWYSNVRLNVTLFVATSTILLVILYAYFSQTTRAKQADEIYSEIHTRYETALKCGDSGLWDWDLSRGRIYWSKSMFEMLNMKATNDIIRFNELTSLINPDDIDLYALACRALEQNQIHVEQIFRMRNSGGEWRWIRLKVESSGLSDAKPKLIGIAEDITDQKLMEEQSYQNDMRLHDAIENLPEAFVLWDDQKRLVLCNSKYQELHQLDADWISPGMPYDAVMKRANPPQISSNKLRNIDSDEKTQTHEVQLEDGRWLQINERFTKDGGFVSVGTDITPIKLNETKLVESEKRLIATIEDLEKSRITLEEQKRKLGEMASKYAAETEKAEAANKAKSEFLANISHELRTPLNAIIGFSEIMNESMFGPLGSPKYEEYTRDIHESGSYLLGMINDVLDMSKIEAGRFELDYEVFNLNEMIEETMRIVSHQSEERNLSIEDRVSPKLVVEADRRAIKQILINLLSNAVKFSQDGGRIQIRARKLRNNITITIEDNGIGISKQDLKKLGRPFEQVQNQFTKSHKGSGLGLAISRSLTQMHQGAMKIISTEGKGTIVSMRIPISRDHERKNVA